MKKLFAIILALMIPCAANATTIIVDHFADASPSIFQNGPGGFLTNTTNGIPAANTIFGTRTLDNIVTSGNTNNFLDISVNTTTTTFSHSQDSGIAGSSRVIWDGNTAGGGGYNPFALAHAAVDLTSSGSNTLISVGILSDDLPYTLTIFFTDALHHVASVNINGGIPGLINLTAIPGAGAAFNTNMTAWAGVDFTQIVGAEMIIQGIGSLDTQVDFIEATAVPEPSTLLLLGAGLLGIGITSRIRRKA